jgi:lysophospholipase L1-like esterase
MSGGLHNASPTRRTVRRLAAALAASIGGLALAALVARQFIRVQARTARRVIGKPFGEDAWMADKLYKKKYGEPIELVLLGDSIAAGLGADVAKHTLGAQLAKRIARSTRRSVNLHTAAVVGSESSMLGAQIANLPAAYTADVAVIIVGGNDVTHRVKTSVSLQHLEDAVQFLQAGGTEVVVGTCPDLSALTAVPQPLRSLIGMASRQLALAQRELVTDLGGRAVSLADLVGPFFITAPDEMFATDRFHPSSAGYRRTAKAMLPSVLAALGYGGAVPAGHYEPAAARDGRDGS